MKNCLCLLLIVFCSGCSLGLVKPELPSDPIDCQSVVGEHDDGEVRTENTAELLNPARSVAQLLVQRLTICNLDESERGEYLTQSMNTQPIDPRVNESMLNQLLFASCTPAKTPGVLNQLLADLTSQGTWPENYAAFFDLLIAGQRAYAAVEKVYMDLKLEHEKTIQGLSDIEAQIEKQSISTQP